MRLSTLDDWSRAHHGIVVFESSGLSRSAWYRAIDAGTIIPVHPLVARLPGAAITPEQRIAAAVAAVGGDILASHRSAARLWGVPRHDNDPVDVLTASLTRGIELDGVMLHRTRDHHDLTRLRRFSIPCTNILRTLVDLGAVDASGVRDAVGHVLATKLADLRAIELALARHARPGRTGVSALRAAIDDWSIEEKPSDSMLEAVMYRLIAAYALPSVEFHAIVERHEVDFRVIGTPVLLECDGWAVHGLDQPTFERDHDRDSELTAAGWIIVRFTYRAITTNPGKTARRIREAIARWNDIPAPDAP